jgi:site-specific DNA-methyltransferase (adenine-specific)
MAFEDTWEWNTESSRVYQEVVEAGGRVAEVMIAFHTFLRDSDMMAYLAMMAPRLIELHRVLKSSGSLYLHCDPTASHYLKMMLDAVFGPINFRNEIIWRRTGSHNSARRYGPIHDTILFYSKSRDYFWCKQYRPYLKGYITSFFNKKDDRGLFRSQTLTGSGTRNKESGQPWRGYNPTPKGRHWAFPSALANELGMSAELTQHEKLNILFEEGLLSPSEVDGLPEYRQYLSQSKGAQLQDLWAYQPYTVGAHQETRFFDRAPTQRRGRLARWRWRSGL